MRASVFIVAALLLAACSSSGASSNANPQTANATNRLRPNTATGDTLTLRFLQISPRHFLDGNPLKMTCVTSATPKFFSLADQVEAKVEIVGDNQGQCKDAGREVDFNLRYLTVHDTPAWLGDLDVSYSPKAGWTAEMKGFSFGGLELCSTPVLTTRVILSDNELIRFGPCS